MPPIIANTAAMKANLNVLLIFSLLIREPTQSAMLLLALCGRVTLITITTPVAEYLAMALRAKMITK
jgi:hypothetical protein